MNWTSWPAPATTARDAPMRSARSSHIASNPALCPPDTTSLGKVGRRQLGQREVALPERSPVAEHGHQWHGGGDQLGGKRVGITPNGPSKSG